MYKSKRHIFLIVSVMIMVCLTTCLLVGCSFDIPFLSDSQTGLPTLNTTALTVDNCSNYLEVSCTALGNDGNPNQYDNIKCTIKVNSASPNFTFSNVTIKIKMKGKYYEGNFGDYVHFESEASITLDSKGVGKIIKIYDTTGKQANHIATTGYEIVSVSGTVSGVDNSSISQSIVLDQSNYSEYLQVTYSIVGIDNVGFLDKNIKCYLYVSPLKTDVTFEDVVITAEIKGRHHEGTYGDYKYFTTTITANVNKGGSASYSKIYSPENPANDIEKVSLVVKSISGKVVL